MNISILGGGSWGTALAIHLAKNKHTISMWEFVVDQAKEMQEKRICRLLPDVKLPDSITVSSDMKQSLKGAELVFIVVPSDKVESTIKAAAPLIAEQSIIICSKGFGADGSLLTDVVSKHVEGKVYCLYGPTHAEEVCKGMLTSIVLAGGHGREQLKSIIENNDLKVYTSDDIIGLQVCSALKNVIAIFVGVLGGMKLGDNAKAYVMTKGLEEIKKIGLKMGAKEETFSGLAGMGDLIVTCTSIHSRNYFVGEEIGKGKKLDDVLKGMKMVAEGVPAVRIAVDLEKKFKLSLPIIHGLADILFEGKNPQSVLRSLH